jgi:hypothetical protein
VPRDPLRRLPWYPCPFHIPHRRPPKIVETRCVYFEPCVLLGIPGLQKRGSTIAIPGAETALASGERWISQIKKKRQIKRMKKKKDLQWAKMQKVVPGLGSPRFPHLTLCPHDERCANSTLVPLIPIGSFGVIEEMPT